MLYSSSDQFPFYPKVPARELKDTPGRLYSLRPPRGASCNSDKRLACQLLCYLGLTAELGYIILTHNYLPILNHLSCSLMQTGPRCWEASGVGEGRSPTHLPLQLPLHRLPPIWVPWVKSGMVAEESWHPSQAQLPRKGQLLLVWGWLKKTKSRDRARKAPGGKMAEFLMLPITW